VNGELEALEEMMQQAMEVLKPGGRLVIITLSFSWKIGL